MQISITLLAREDLTHNSITFSQFSLSDQKPKTDTGYRTFSNAFRTSEFESKEKGEQVAHIDYREYFGFVCGSLIRQHLSDMGLVRLLIQGINNFLRFLLVGSFLLLCIA